MAKKFFEMTASLIGRAVEAVLRVTDEQRLAVLEERSTIARELHDSIAQSLSFPNSVTAPAACLDAGRTTRDGSGGPFRTRSWHFYGLSAA